MEKIKIDKDVHVLIKDKVKTICANERLAEDLAKRNNELRDQMWSVIYSKYPKLKGRENISILHKDGVILIWDSPEETLLEGIRELKHQAVKCQKYEIGSGLRDIERKLTTILNKK